jgi:hypothetical protein
MTNLYIESIEGGTYIAGIGETKATEFLRDTTRDSPQFQSLSELKEQLAGRTFDKVWLKQNTPYDEMIGSDIKDDKLMIELEWS